MLLILFIPINPLFFYLNYYHWLFYIYNAPSKLKEKNKQYFPSAEKRWFNGLTIFRQIIKIQDKENAKQATENGLSDINKHRGQPGNKSSHTALTPASEGTPGGDRPATDLPQTCNRPETHDNYVAPSPLALPKILRVQRRPMKRIPLFSLSFFRGEICIACEGSHVLTLGLVHAVQQPGSVFLKCSALTWRCLPC